MADLSGMAAIDQIMAKMHPPKNPAPLGKRIVSELQRKQLAGLDDKRRSLDSTLASLKSPNTSQMSHDSLFLATPLRGPKGGSEFVPRQDRFLERLKANRALQEKIEKNLGPCDRHQKFKPPPVKLDDTSCSSADEAENNTTVDKENKEVTMNETFELAAGSQGRKGQGCSTPRHVNNTLAPLRQIDISAVSMDSNRAGARSSVDLPAADAVEEPMEVDEPEEVVNNVFALFGAKASQSQKKDEVKGNTLPAKENSQGGTFTIGKVETNETFTVQDVAKSATVDNDDKDKPNSRLEDSTTDVVTDINKTNTIQANIGNQTNEKLQNIEDGTFVVEKKTEKNLYAEVSIKDKTIVVSDEQPGPSNRSESHTSFNKKCPGQKRQPMNSLLHNLSTMPSPASKTFGFVQRPFKRPNVKTPTRKGIKNTEIEDQEKTINMSKITNNEPSINGDDSSMVDPVTDPREHTPLPPETTPKRSISRMSVSRISRISTPQTPRSSDRPHYAKPTIAFKKKCVIELDDSSEAEKTMSPHNPIDPSQMMMPNPSKSGFRPRAETGRSRFISTLHEMNRSLAGQLNTTEDRRKQYMDRRVNDYSMQSRAPIVETANISQPALVPPPDVVAKPLSENNRRSSEAVVENVRQSVVVYEDPSTEDLHRTAERLVINDEREASLEQNATATAIIGAVVPLPSPVPPPDHALPEYNNGGYDSDDGVAGAYDDMLDDTFDQREKTNARLVSLFSVAPETPVHHRNRHELTMNSIVEEDSMVEETADFGRTEMILKPRELIIPATPEQPGLRRSNRTRMAPVRTYLGEKALYENSPSGGQRLVGTNRVLVTDPQYIKARTTNPVKVCERQKKKADKKKKDREHKDSV